MKYVTVVLLGSIIDNHFQKESLGEQRRMTWVFFMKQKSEVFSIFKKFKSFVEKQSGCYIKTLRSDRGMEYTSSQFGNFCEDEGVERQLTVAYTPQQRGVVERKNQTVMEMAKAMLYEKGLSKIFWAEAINTAVYLLNRCPTKALLNKTPIEAWSGRKPSVRHFKVFGCLCYSQVPKERRSKLDETSEKCIFMATWNWEEGKILRKQFLLMNFKQKHQLKLEMAALQLHHLKNPQDQFHYLPQLSLQLQAHHHHPQLQEKMRSLTDVYERCNLCIVEPQSFEEATKDED
ncbi:Retrovirus-related Pol polyprotein from transposon TNT 1-94 [Vitis vinifera]|uniref:Retrovirus-related Pol polyprotein from transposon TNT 1-94 n=1 Tax=Vitis vinifera TaxID=29760 RepID=A0A438BZ55_VITVI|nr:Retrovirus-related Pol polyprotein from transposon TNT 1-94 [Vitis vinifera]